jgi:antibiotic biosynthesis monooxygenase (ABM) superfamily enzyme
VSFAGSQCERVYRYSWVLVPSVTIVSVYGWVLVPSVTMVCVYGWVTVPSVTMVSVTVGLW